jgi:hypothetical protein
LNENARQPEDHHECVETGEEDRWLPEQRQAYYFKIKETQ